MSAGEDAPARRDGKSPSAFRTTGEVAEELRLAPHVLRFWESKFSELKPLKRGGGRRYYRPEDVALLREIQALLYREGYTIRGVQKLLREGARGEKEPPVEAPTTVPASGRGEEARQHPADEVRELRAALEEVRGELRAIRALLDRAAKGEG